MYNVRTSWVQIAATIALLSDKIIVGANTASAVQVLLASCLMLILSNLPAELTIAQILQVQVLKWSQYCGPPVTVYTVIGGEESWLHWWFAWLKLHVRA